MEQKSVEAGKRKSGSRPNARAEGKSILLRNGPGIIKNPVCYATQIIVRNSPLPLPAFEHLQVPNGETPFDEKTESSGPDRIASVRAPVPPDVRFSAYGG